MPHSQTEAYGPRPRDAAASRTANGQHGQSRTSTNGARPQKARIVATYPYRDENGVLQYEVVRLQPKSFCQRRPEKSAQGGWAWNMHGVKPRPYRLLELPDAIARRDAIFT